MDWTPLTLKFPEQGIVVNTKIDDKSGSRMECKLIFDKGLWWLQDKSMYVYYTPTHWSYT